MKKLLIVLPALLIVAACAKAPSSELSSLSIPDSYDSSDSEETKTYTATLTKGNCGLTTDDSTEEIVATIKSKQDSEVDYSVKIGAPCYLSDKYNEFIMKQGGYIKSNSNYHVDRLIIDFFGKKGTNYDVYANVDGTGEKIAYHESSIQPEDPNDGGIVYEYPINGTEWCISNSTVYKPAFYSITIVFSK